MANIISHSNKSHKTLAFKMKTYLSLQPHTFPLKYDVLDSNLSKLLGIKFMGIILSHPQLSIMYRFCGNWFSCTQHVFGAICNCGLLNFHCRIFIIPLTITKRNSNLYCEITFPCIRILKCYKRTPTIRNEKI